MSSLLAAATSARADARSTASMSASTTRSPIEAHRMAAALPRPAAPPVMTAVRPGLSASGTARAHASALVIVMTPIL
eukprot:2644730-Prymnesium_polylepis.1